MFNFLLKVHKRLILISSKCFVFYNRIHWKNFNKYGKDIILNGKCSITGHDRINFGNNIHLGNNSRIRGEGGLFIGDNTHISRNVVIYTINHNFNGLRLPYDDTQNKNEVRIGKNVWIGINVIILPGSIISDGAIIGAGTVISGFVPPLNIAVGSKYRISGKRDSNTYDYLVENNQYGGIDGRNYNVNN